MNVLIVDPALHSRGGHHYTAVDRLRQELRRAGAAARCLGSAQVDDATRAALDCQPVFSRSVYGRPDGSDRQFRADVETAARELAGALRGAPEPDLLVLPCCDAVLAAAVARTVPRGHGRRRPRVLLWLLYGPHPLRAPDDPQVAPRLAQARQAYAALDAVTEVRAWCETPAMAAFWQDAVPFRVGVQQGPGLALAPRPARATAAPLVSCIGFANRAKGYRLLPEALDQVLRQDASVRFLVHGIVQGSDAEQEAPLFDRLAALGERVEVRRDVLDANTYGDLLQATDLLLLPYDPAVYGVRGSGLFADARRAGVPVVAPRACAFARPAFDEGWGIAMETHDAAALARAILAGLAQRDDLARRAAAAAAHRSDGLAALLRDALADPPAPAPPRRGFLHRLWPEPARFWRRSPRKDPVC